MKSNPRKKGEQSNPSKKSKKQSTESNAKQRGELAPLRLGEKLKQIRENVPGLTQGKMLLFINPNEKEEDNRARVSQYERSKRVPSLVETYNYAKFTGVPVETLLDDAIDLPAAIRNNLDGLEKPKEEAAQNENAEIGKENSSNNADTVENSESENLSRHNFDKGSENPEKQPGLNADEAMDEAMDEAPDDEDHRSETASAAEVLPNASGNLSPLTTDTRFQRAAATDVADHVAASVTDGNINHPAVAADDVTAILSIRLSGEILNDSKTVYLESLGKLPFEEMGRFFTPQQFLEQALAAAFDDYRANGTASALARRLRFFVGEDE